jgi:hypothetical protein
MIRETSEKKGLLPLPPAPLLLLLLLLTIDFFGLHIVERGVTSRVLIHIL